MILGGFAVRLAVIRPGQEIPRPAPGRTGCVVDLDNGARLVLISEGPTPAYVLHLEDFFTRLNAKCGRSPDVPVDWAEVEGDVFRSFGSASPISS